MNQTARKGKHFPHASSSKNSTTDNKNGRKENYSLEFEKPLAMLAQQIEALEKQLGTGLTPSLRMICIASISSTINSRNQFIPICAASITLLWRAIRNVLIHVTI